MPLNTPEDALVSVPALLAKVASFKFFVHCASFKRVAFCDFDVVR